MKMVGNNYSNLENRVGGYMSGDGGHEHSGGAAHGASHDAPHGGHKRKQYDVGHEAQELYDGIFKHIDPDFHKATAKKHNEAYSALVAKIAGKTFDNRMEAEEALTDLVIEYKTKVGMPVSKDPNHRSFVYDEVRQALDQMRKNNVDVDDLLMSGNAYKLFDNLHSSYVHEVVTSKTSYSLRKHLHGKEPALLSDVYKAHLNYVGREVEDTEIASAGANLDALVNTFTKHADDEVTRMIKFKKQRSGGAHGDHAAHGAHGGAGHAAPAHH